jgi:hypothetical protein
MKLQPRKELLASDNSGLLLYYPQLRTNDFVSFFFLLHRSLQDCVTLG